MAAGVRSAEAVKAKAFARNYVAFAEALRQEGVPEERACEEARLAALTLLRQADEAEQLSYDPARGPCPTCKRG